MEKLIYHQQVVLQLMKDCCLDHLCILEKTVVRKYSPEVHQRALVTMKILDHSKDCVEVYYLRNYNKVSQSAITSSKVTIETLEQRCEICSKLTIKPPKQLHWRRFGSFIVNFEHISHLFL